MGKYSVPEHIRAMKPRGTMVKAIGGRYYVYEYRSVTEDGRRKTRMGRCIGKIEEGAGYVPNANANAGAGAGGRADAGAAGGDEVARLRARVAELEASLEAVRGEAARALGNG